MTAKSLPHQDEKHVFDRGVVHARYGRIRTGQRNRPFFKDCRYSYCTTAAHVTGYNRFRSKVLCHTTRKTGVFDVVWHKILDLSHTLEQKTPHPNQTSRQDPSPPAGGRWHAAPEGGQTAERMQNRRNTRPHHRPLRGSPPGPAIKDGLRPPARARTNPYRKQEPRIELAPSAGVRGTRADARRARMRS